MIKTGKDETDGRTFGRVLLSEYLPDLGLDRHMAYRELKTVIKQAMELPAGSDAREEKAREFFALLKQSFVKVTEELHSMEQEAHELEKMVKQQAADDLAKDPSILFDAYAKVHRIDHYRQLNVKAFARIMEKFLTRIAVSSLELQAKLRKADGIIAKSTVSVPTYPTTNAKETIAATLSVVSKRTLEAAFEVLDESVERNANFTTRIVPFRSAHHFRDRSKHQQMQGTFAAKIISGTSNRHVAKHINAVLRSSANVKSDIGRFANGEVSMKVLEAIRADDVYVVQSMASSSDEKSHTMSSNIVELMLALQAATLASCARLTAVIPYMAYSKRTSQIGALAEMIQSMGCHRVITVDLFAEQVEGMFNIPVDNVSARDEFAAYLLERWRATGSAMTNITVVSPNADNVARARSFADRLMKMGRLDPETQFVGVASAVKRADNDGIDVAGVVDGRECIIVDNVVDEAMAATQVATRLRQMGATTVRLVATHALLSGEGPSRLKTDAITEIVTTDSINQDRLLADVDLAPKLRILPVAPLLAGVIDCVHSNVNAVSELLEK